MSAVAALTDAAAVPRTGRAPLTIDETGLPANAIEQILIKTLYAGELSGHALSDRMRLSYPVLEPIVERVRIERLVEVRGATGTSSAGYRYALTDLGRDRARSYLDVNQYVGPAPVPLSAYVADIRARSAARGYIDRERLLEGFSNLIVSDLMLEQLGPAVNANKAIFLYGSPGNGKTVIAEGLGRAIGGDMYLPYAVEIDGQIITIFDPVTHQVVEEPQSSTIVMAVDPHDRRWVRVRRPVVMVGGELTLDMLDLTFNPLSKFSEAPLQVKANGGVFLVDDFGRQRMRPEDLLNRWIVPLESRVDYLTLHTGKKFEVPFDVLTIFATNLDPASLADEAFLRRIPYKIAVGDPELHEFSQIFELNCRRRGLSFDPSMMTYLHQEHYRATGRPLRACHPRDLLDQMTALCRYRGVEPMVSPELIDAACRSYFVDTSSRGAMLA